MHGDAQAMVESLRQLVELEDEATRSVTESRARASLTESMFREAMQAKEEGRSFQPNVSKLIGSGSELSRTLDRARKQEVTFMQCWRILMRLSADPRLREPAERVADNLERYRLVRYETDPMPEIDPNAPCEVATGRIMDFMGSMGDVVRRRAERWDELIARETEFLRQTLDAAEALAQIDSQ